MAQDAPPTGTSTSRSTDANEAKGAAKDLGQSARDAGQKAASAATHEAQHQAEAARGRAADEVSDISVALRRAAEETREGSPQERTFGMLAETLADAADAIRTKDLGEVTHDLSTFARRNPLAFLGGAALVGFAATRFAKASSRPDVPRTDPRTAPPPAPMATEPLGSTTPSSTGEI